VKTTKPERYLVQPAHGVICPNRSETVQIVLVEKDKKFLLELFHEAGQAAIENSNDQLRIQFFSVAPPHHDWCMWKDPGSKQGEFISSYLARNYITPRLFNKQLDVRHSVVHTSAGKSASCQDSGSSSEPAPTDLHSMAMDQLVAEVLMLRARAKYEELGRVLATTKEETDEE
jgi:MSP (Major sperm protein) domain